MNIKNRSHINITQFIILNSAFLIFISCSVQKQISKSADKLILQDSSLTTAHVGISIYEPATNKYWFNYQGDHYFIPASNTKIPTCYAAMKYLGDSLISAKISIVKDSALEIYPSGDPTFLNTEFSYQPLFKRMKQFKKIYLYADQWKDKRWGNGWAWNDYDATYMAERSPFPIYGNLIDFLLSKNILKISPKITSIYYDTTIDYNVNTGTIKSNKFRLERYLDANDYYLRKSSSAFTQTFFPFRADLGFVSSLLEDTLKIENVCPFSIADGYNYSSQKEIIHSQPTDSLLKPMMHRSDNFFAEQTLLMISNERLGIMNDEKIIDTLLKTDFKDLPQKPRWVDGSGLSRYNLFSPQDFIFIFNKMKNDFGMERIKIIFPTGNEGTLNNYYKTDSGYIYAKTGTLSGVVSLSGFLYTKRNKLLVFSVLVNNHNSSATAARRAVEKFIKSIREKY
jgi:D-alanyl-D-alanine carboxypeptidase/D-alanyl-D-alanine-endopeptidase (penicillin-binding protein 4)